jgi:hypothetical protein
MKGIEYIREMVLKSKGFEKECRSLFKKYLEEYLSQLDMGKAHQYGHL